MNERHGYAGESAVFCAVMQWLMLVLTYVVMALLERLARGAPLEALATLILGFLIVAGLIAGTIAARLHVPRLVGYVLAGVIAGPAWLNLAGGSSADVPSALAPVATGALALIAFAVGNEISFDVWRGARERRVAMGRMLLGTMGAPFLAVTLVVLSVSPWFFLTAHQPFGDALAVALTLGIFAATSSPAIAWSTIVDSGADPNGPLARTTIDVGVAQDLVAVVFFIIMLAILPLAASQGAVAPGMALHTLLVLAASLASGALLALGAAQYLRVMQGTLVWVLLVFAFVVTQVVRLAGLDAVLIALAAGVTLRNAVPAASARVRGELARCALPVYVVFFALAGSTMRLDALADVAPWALLLVALRLVYLWVGLRWAGRHSAVDPGFARFGALGLVSQGGLMVTLAALARRAFPEWNVSLEALVVAMMGVHQLAGPISFQWALRRTGELDARARGAEGLHDSESGQSPPVLAAGGDRM
jgi:Kef-type K+ transport system membrane component KefB